ncbi:MAG: preprotein translocase subunit YajC [Bacteroidaceae bacterium]|nr:preprotein translocase subunit YajC [Bacteroidaceae bacterium]MBO4590323.1 preprotein translocase subunit YajC [Bacteroidaceae bacterium]MBR5962769.1 preprotein translocase subunit YajC [Bacteroidaceae bacterium]
MIPLQDAAPAATGSGSFFANPLFLMILLLVVMYVFMILPQRKQQKQIEAQRRALQVGSKVVTSGGVYGVIKDIVEENGKEIVVVEIATGVKIRIDKSSVFADTGVNPQQTKR